MAHTVEYALFQEFSRNNSTACDIPVKLLPVCEEKDSVFFDAELYNQKHQKQPTFAGWRLFEDRPSKPGWIAEQFPDNSIEFPLAHMNTSLQLFFLQSYAGKSWSSIETYFLPI
jgi:hypothetical protein